ASATRKSDAAAPAPAAAASASQGDWRRGPLLHRRIEKPNRIRECVGSLRRFDRGDQGGLASIVHAIGEQDDRLAPLRFLQDFVRREENRVVKRRPDPETLTAALTSPLSLTASLTSAVSSATISPTPAKLWTRALRQS